jgi:N-acetylneuraminate synthase
MRTIAEIGINHNGDIEIAKQLIRVCSAAGVDVVKFQKRNPDVCVPESEKGKIRETPWGDMTYLEYKYRLEFGMNEYCAIDALCKTLGIQWTASVWDVDSLNFMTNFDVTFIKIPSAHLTNMKLIRECAESGLPVMLSTGMADMAMVDDAMEHSLWVSGILHCVSTYPSKPEEQNMKCITTLKEKYPTIPIGFSNHHPGLTFLTIAPAFGAEILEFHVTLDRSMWGTDQAASIEPDGIFKLMKRLKDINASIGDGNKRIMEREVPIMNKLRGG